MVAMSQRGIQDAETAAIQQVYVNLMINFINY